MAETPVEVKVAEIPMMYNESYASKRWLEWGFLNHLPSISAVYLFSPPPHCGFILALGALPSASMLHKAPSIHPPTLTSPRCIYPLTVYLDCLA